MLVPLNSMPAAVIPHARPAVAVAAGLIAAAAPGARAIVIAPCTGIAGTARCSVSIAVSVPASVPVPSPFCVPIPVSVSVPVPVSVSGAVRAFICAVMLPVAQAVTVATAVPIGLPLIVHQPAVATPPLTNVPASLGSPSAAMLSVWITLSGPVPAAL